MDEIADVSVERPPDISRSWQSASWGLPIRFRGENFGGDSCEVIGPLVSGVRFIAGSWGTNAIRHPRDVESHSLQFVDDIPETFAVQ